MAPIEMLDKAAARAAREAQRGIERVDAVYDDQLWNILEHFGLLERLDAGELRCAVTSVPLTRDNIGGLIGTPSGPRLIADSYEAAMAVGAHRKVG